jgi:hypothetical protein
MNEHQPDSPLAKIVQALAAEFGDGWSVDGAASYAHGVFLDGPDVRLFVRDPEYRHGTPPTRLEISGSIPATVPRSRRNGAGYGFDWGKIGVAGTRPVPQIRAEIERRLLETARTAFVGVLEREARDAAERAARQSVRDQLATLLPRPRLRQEDESATSSVITTYAATGLPVHGEWTIDHDGSHVDVTLSGLTPAQARQIAVLLYRKAS